MTKKRFQGPSSPHRQSKNILRWLRFFRRIKRMAQPVIPEDHVLPKQTVLKQLKDVEAGHSLTWIGHVTFLVRIHGITLLTDPFFSDYASPIQGMGLKRFVPPALTLDDLPAIDAILISHNHYDHLDKPTLKAIANKQRIHVIIPKGLGDFFRQLGFTLIHELSWFDSFCVKQVRIRALPAIHYSRRGLFDKNKSLWLSFSIESPSKKIFFSGDTAYGDCFKALGETYGPYDYGLIGIGAYAPSELMAAVHVNPEEAVLLAKDLQVKTIVGMHWGTIVLSAEPAFEPPQLLQQASLQHGYDPASVWVLNIGESREL